MGFNPREALAAIQWLASFHAAWWKIDDADDDDDAPRGGVLVH